eukprot:CAMPEP_0113877816 /NCGR_PEP_ID=MMETSP0780_2-20120614/6320_1 /TAXON_ID=652834 /ORGANISM="Palpitomonas bilix" /LENGTH=127 /DNA_ID=CAMNT_0000864183 /DNA_START=238 /DNA_END=617 /DNA_ORIENTATION=- /assembly_acc=CAM_ASM_000599
MEGGGVLGMDVLHGGHDREVVGGGGGGATNSVDDSEGPYHEVMKALDQLRSLESQGVSFMFFAVHPSASLRYEYISPSLLIQDKRRCDDITSIFRHCAAAAVSMHGGASGGGGVIGGKGGEELDGDG